LNLPIEKSFIIIDEYHDAHTVLACMRDNHIVISFFDKEYICCESQYHHNILTTFVNDKKFEVTLIAIENTFYIFGYHFSGILSLDEKIHGIDDLEENIGHLRAPMPGAITLIKTAVGQNVKSGEPLLILEAMKMEHTLYAPFDGQVTSITYEAGMMVQEGDELIVLEALNT
jgi:3-methylcrotonyl-CoA carboxylase alpha subunit